VFDTHFTCDHCGKKEPVHVGDISAFYQSPEKAKIPAGWIYTEVKGYEMWPPASYIGTPSGATRDRFIFSQDQLVCSKVCYRAKLLHEAEHGII
jgi:hypothetical protein